MTEPASSSLDGLTVIGIGGSRAVAYAGRLLGDFGAEVLVLERDAGERERAFGPGPSSSRECQMEARVRFLHGGKRSAFFDAGSEAQRHALSGLLEAADVLIVGGELGNLDRNGLSPERLAEQHPQLVAVAVTMAGLGQGRGLAATDLVAHAISGIAFGTGGTVPSLEEYPPLRPGGYQAEYTTGLSAASAALIGLQLRRRTGKGSLIDTSMQATLASFMRMSVAYRVYEASDVMNLGYASRQAKNGKRSSLWGLVPCKDGWFAFQASEQWQWDGLMKMMGNPEWSKQAQFLDPLDRTRYWDELEPYFVSWCLEHSKTEIFHTAQANHVPVFPCYNVEELIEDPQQQYRGFLVDLPAGASNLVKVPGALIHLEKTPWRHDNEPPWPGQHTAEVFSVSEGNLRTGAWRSNAASDRPSLAVGLTLDETQR